MRTLPTVLLLSFLCPVVIASDADEFKVKRQGPFEFAQKPAVTRDGDRIAISFETKALCDVTIAIEDPGTKIGGAPRIVRHLASGLLGPNAPAPFAKGSKKQVVVWDGKDDKGEYIDDKDALTVRVSLGLKPQFERTLYWSPEKRLMGKPLPMAACPEGVLVFDGIGVDHIRLFGHDGEYLRTVYPFPADKLDQVVGLDWVAFPQDGKKLPRKQGCQLATLLTSGTSAICTLETKVQGGTGATAMAAAGGRVILAMEYVNRLAVDGTTGGHPLKGGRTALDVAATRGPRGRYHPYSAAVSPDQKWLYLACYGRRNRGNWHCREIVQRVALEGAGQPERFPAADPAKQPEARFDGATSVDCDAKGNVYITDYAHDRIQVFASDGTFVRSIPVKRPSMVRIDRRTNDIYCFSWWCDVTSTATGPAVPACLHRLTPLPEAKPVKTWALPLRDRRYVWTMYESAPGYATFSGEIDFGAKELTVWIGQERADTGLWGVHGGDGGRVMSGTINTLVFKERDGKLALVRDFGKETAKAVYRADATDFGYARLYVNPQTGMLYVKENRGAGKTHGELIEIDPIRGRIRGVPMRFGAEDLCFDADGHIYLRSLQRPVGSGIVGRFNFATWREVPWDYGEELGGLASALPFPGRIPVFFHEGGLGVNARGRLVMSCADYSIQRPARWGKQIDMSDYGGQPYQPLLYPGRSRWQSVHIWDKHGKVAHTDAFPGTTIVDGVAIDSDDNIYILTAPGRTIGGKPVVDIFTETLIKAKPGKARVLSAGRAELPLPEASRPQRPTDLAGKWVEGAEWLYGGVGYGGMNGGPGGGCACWHPRFCLDELRRSFAPEIGHHTVAVLDTNGNVILRIGRYGNVDDGMPSIRSANTPQNAPKRSASTLSTEPPNQRSIGGDEVALFYPQFVATLTDRRLFISDTGNARILSVTLGYHAEEKIALKDVKDGGR